MTSTHLFQPGSGPLPDSDPEACDRCGEREDHPNHYVPDPSLREPYVSLFTPVATTVDVGDEDDHYREASPPELADYLSGRRTFPGAVESEHGLFLLIDPAQDEEDES